MRPASCRLLDLRPTSGARTRPARCTPTAAESHRLRQRTGVHSKAMFFWSQYAGVKLHFIQPGKPTQNAFVESFNGKFREYCPNPHWFVSLEDARSTIDAWRDHYNRWQSLTRLLSHRLWRCEKQRLCRCRSRTKRTKDFSSSWACQSPDKRRNRHERMAKPSSREVVLPRPRSHRTQITV